MIKFFVLIALAAALLSTSACNTVRGVGRDVEEVGDSVKDAAN